MIQVEEKTQKKTSCSKCNSEFLEDEIQVHDDQSLCQDCFDKYVRICASCEESFWEDDLYLAKDLLYCETCLAENFRCCTSCEEYENADNARYSELRGCYYCSHCASDQLEYCSNCDLEIDPEGCSRNGDGEGFCERCFEEGQDSDERVQHFEFPGTSFRQCISKRKYGVEIEACLEEGSDHLTENEFGSWSKQRDGSLGEHGREYASPILQGDEGFKEIETLTARLRNRGYFVNNSCGLHVHIDGRDLGFEDIKKLLKLILTYEPVVYAMLPEARYTGTYSVPLQKFPPSRFRIKVRDEKTLKAMWYGRDRERVNTNSKYHHSRYFGVNIHSWFFRRSIEFRYHSGTLNARKIMNFITLCQAFVDKAKEAKKARVRTFETFQEQFEGFVSLLGLSPDLTTYVRERILKFHPEKFQDLSSLTLSNP